MGMTLNQNLGPFIELKLKFHEKNYPKFVCNNRQCKSYLKELRENFCSHCGKAKEEIIITKKEPIVDLTNLIEEEFDESLYIVMSENSNSNKDVIILLDNRYSDRIIYLKDEEYNLQINPDNIQNDLYSFTNQFSKEIERLKSLFGENSVKVQWGVVSNWS